jgi:hypothetical protein
VSIIWYARTTRLGQPADSTRSTLAVLPFQSLGSANQSTPESCYRITDLAGLITSSFAESRRHVHGLTFVVGPFHLAAGFQLSRCTNQGASSVALRFHWLADIDFH